MKEEWRIVEEVPEYFVSNRGRIRNGISGPFIIPYLNEGHRRVSLRRKGKSVNRHVARLVAKAFITSHIRGFDVRHIDGVKTNDLVENLTLRKRGRQASLIRVVETGIVYKGQVECARALNTHQSNISRCLNGYLDSVQGYTLEYVDAND